MLHFNIFITVTDSTETMSMFTCGMKDIFTTFFYLLICIIAHAVVQEYILDVSNIEHKLLLFFHYLSAQDYSFY